MKLMTAEIERKLPVLYSQEDNEDPTVWIHYFNSMGIGDWHIIEGRREDGDWVFFGLCDLGYPELGYVLLSDLNSVPSIERDMYWTPKPLSEVRK